MISRGTGLSAVFRSILLFSQVLLETENGTSGFRLIAYSYPQSLAIPGPKIVNRLLAQLPQFEWQVFCFQCGRIGVFTTSLQIRGVQGVSGRVFAAGLPDGRWGG